MSKSPSLMTDERVLHVTPGDQNTATHQAPSQARVRFQANLTAIDASLTIAGADSNRVNPRGGHV